MLWNDADMAATMAVLGAAAATYGLRLGGLLLSEQLPQNGGFRRFMEALPGTILLSLVAPGILAAGTWGALAAASTALCTWKTRNVFLSMIIGVAIVAAARRLGL
jgi:uncharacterized membrane protein